MLFASQPNTTVFLTFWFSIDIKDLFGQTGVAVFTVAEDDIAVEVGAVATSEMKNRKARGGAVFIRFETPSVLYSARLAAQHITDQ